MRILELSITVSLLAYIIHLLSPQRSDYLWLSFIPFFCSLVVALHFLIEGYRWQMLPVYSVLCASMLYETSPGFTDVQAQFAGGQIALCGLGLAIVLSTVFPVFQVPAPTGSFAVGTQTRYLVDNDRRDPVDPGGSRKIMVQIWYPARTPEHGRIATYRERATTGVWDARLALVKTHSIVDAPLAAFNERFPLLLYAPSWNGMRTENTSQAEELASHGYVVVGIDHPYSSLATVFPDGRVVRTKLLDEDFYSSDAAFLRFMETIETEIRIRADDARFVLDAVQHLDADDPKESFTNHLDLDRVGIFGFSLGGGVAAQACFLDRRFKACVNMDGVMACESLKQGTGAPIMIMSQGDPLPPESMPDALPATRREMKFNWEQFTQVRKLLSVHGGDWLAIAKTKHFNFQDYAFSSPLHRYSHAGAIAPTKAARIIGRYLLAFFDQHLKGIDQPLLDGRSRHFSDVRFEKFEPTVEK